jgi:integrase
MGRKGSQQRVDRGIYRDAIGFAIKVQVRGVRQEVRFPPDTALETLQQQRDQLRADLHNVSPLLERGTLAHDAERYLKQIAGRPGFKADRSHLRAWLDRLGPKHRSRITPADIRLALADWRTKGTHLGGRGKRARRAVDAPASLKTLKERYRVLKHLYRTLDGPKAKTPLDDVPQPKPAAPTPIGVHLSVVRRVARALYRRCKGTIKISPERQDYARFLLLVTSGQRPAQVMRAQLEDFHLQESYWVVRGAKGGPSHAIHLNREMRMAARTFMQTKAFGKYDDKALLALVRSNGWPIDIPLYNARHSLVMDAIQRGADLGDIQALLGHASIETTRRFYGPILRLREKQVGRKLEGRLKLG